MGEGSTALSPCAIPADARSPSPSCCSALGEFGLEVGVVLPCAPRSDFHGVMEKDTEQCEGFESIISSSERKKNQSRGLPASGPQNKGFRVRQALLCPQVSTLRTDRVPQASCPNSVSCLPRLPRSQVLSPADGGPEPL